MPNDLNALNPNPGGTLAPRQIIGRDALIKHYWEILETRSLALLAPRRLGKTSICRRMEAFPDPSFRPRIRDLQGLSSAQEFVLSLFEVVEDLLSPSQRLAQRARNLWQKLTGSVQIKDYRLELAETVRRMTLEILDAVAVAESPLDLDAIRQRLGHPHREDLLEILKALRRDLYLVREDGKYRFRFAFLRRYWRLEREL